MLSYKVKTHLFPQRKKKKLPLPSKVLSTPHTSASIHADHTEVQKNPRTCAQGWVKICKYISKLLCEAAAGFWYDSKLQNKSTCEKD